MSQAKYVKEITVIDPDSKMPVGMVVYKHENGGMFAMDASYLDQCAEDEDDDSKWSIADPFAATFIPLTLTE